MSALSEKEAVVKQKPLRKEKKMSDLHSKLEAIKTAKKEIVDGSLVIWSARLETFSNAGNLQGFLEAMQSPVEAADINNCGCNVQCGSVAAELAGRGQPLGLSSMGGAKA
jgi:hypothetical protein